MTHGYEAIFHGETSSTQVLANKAAWITILSFDELQKEEPDKLAKFSAACTRLSTAATEIDLFVADDLNRLNFEALKKQLEEALQLAKDSGKQWKSKKAKDLKKIKSLKNTFDWNAIFNGVDKDVLLKIVDHLHKTNDQFKAAVDNAAAHRMIYITELAIKNKDLECAPANEMLRKFTAGVLEECAGLLALRLKGYTDVFYLSKLNPAIEDIATFTFPINEDPSETSELNVILNKINKTPLKFHTPSQYKPIVKNPPNNNKKLHEKESSRLPLYQLHTAGVDKEAFYNAFFNSTNIPVEAKVKTFEKLACASDISKSAQPIAEDLPYQPFSRKYATNSSPKQQHMSGSGSSMNSASTSEVSSRSDEEDPSIANAIKILKRVVLAAVNALADELEESGQLSKDNRNRILYEVFQEVGNEMREIAYGSGQSTQRFLPPPPKQQPQNAEFKDFN
jgi:hypothetical protein